jgi:hypothetical protein
MSQLPDLYPSDIKQQPEAPALSGLPDLYPRDYARQKALSLLRTTDFSVTPDQAVKDVQLGRALDLPPDMVAMDRKSAEAAFREKTLTDKLQGAPNYVDWMQNPLYGQMSLDDAENMVGLEKTLNPESEKSYGDIATENFALGVKKFELIKLYQSRMEGNRSPTLEQNIRTLKEEVSEYSTG